MPDETGHQQVAGGQIRLPIVEVAAAGVLLRVLRNGGREQQRRRRHVASARPKRVLGLQDRERANWRNLRVRAMILPPGREGAQREAETIVDGRRGLRRVIRARRCVDWAIEQATTTPLLTLPDRFGRDATLMHRMGVAPLHLRRSDARS